MKKTKWVTAVFLAAFHAGAIGALWCASWPLFWLALAVWAIGLCPGVGACFHRLLTHRGYKVPAWLEYLLTVCGCLALQGGPIWWVATHRKHHKYSDEAGLDPHTPKDGFFWAHMGWLVSDRDGSEILAQYAPDLLKVPAHVWINRLFWVPVTLLGLLLWNFWGWQAVLWGVCLSVTVSWHCTWLVNSATHIWGSRRYQTRDNSRNSWWVALLSFGEGWHNNHHAQPTLPKHGQAWYELDLNWAFIRLMLVLGLARK